jgi:flagellar hook-associated protein 2
MTGIQLTGLGSGLDTESIITQLMAVERRPRTVISNKQASAQARQTALQDIQSKLTALKTATSALKSMTTWGNSQTVESADPTKATARAIAGASPGGHLLVVSQLARGAQATYTYASPATNGSVTVNGVAVNVPAGATLDAAVTAINDATYPAGAAVFAVNVNGQLAISSRTTGAASQAVVSGLGAQSGPGLVGLDAQGTMDGTAFTSASNVVTSALPGVELTLKGITGASGTSITVGSPGPAADTVVSTVKSFVSAYNSVVDAVRSRTTEKRVPAATTASDAAKGSLFGDSGLSGMLDSLRSTLGTVTGVPTDPLRTLADLGISTGAVATTVNADSVAGKLTLDETALRAKLSTDPTGVKRVLAGTGTSPAGFAQTFDGVLTPLQQTNGALSGRLDAASSELSTLAATLTRFDDRMTSKEGLLRKQFTALETAMAANNATLARVKAQFGLA